MLRVNWVLTSSAGSLYSSCQMNIRQKSRVFAIDRSLNEYLHGWRTSENRLSIMNSMLTLPRQWVNLFSVKTKLFAKADELYWCRDNVVEGGYLLFIVQQLCRI